MRARAAAPRREAVAFVAEHEDARAGRAAAPSTGGSGSAARRREARPPSSRRRAARSSAVRPRHAGRERHLERRAHRRADGLAVERVGAGGVRAARRRRRTPRRHGTSRRRCRRCRPVRGRRADDAPSRQLVPAPPPAGRSPMARHPRWMLKPAIAFISSWGTTKTGQAGSRVHQVGHRRRAPWP